MYFGVKPFDPKSREFRPLSQTTEHRRPVEVIDSRTKRVAIVVVLG